MHERAQRGSLVSLSRGAPPVTSILHPLVRSQANFDMRKGCERMMVWRRGAWGGRLGERERDFFFFKEK